MALIIPPGFVQATYVIRLTGDTEDMIVTCGHEIDGASGANTEDAANDLHNAFGLSMVPQMGNPYSLVYTAVYIGNDGPTTVAISDAAPYVGQGGAACAPQNTAYLIRKRTDLGGRRGRGRLYLPGVPEAAVDNVGSVLAAQVTALQTACDSWMARLTTAVGARYYPPVVLHRSEGIGVEPAPTPIVRFVPESRVATQRRRLRP